MLWPVSIACPRPHQSHYRSQGHMKHLHTLTMWISMPAWPSLCFPVQFPTHASCTNLPMPGHNMPTAQPEHVIAEMLMHLGITKWRLDH